MLHDPQTTIPLSWRIKCFLNPIIDKKYYRSLSDYFQALFFCQHNARVIADFESRMSSVIYTATGGKMSKPYYDKEVMVSIIEDELNEQYELGYREGQEEKHHD